jgi:hypothetical protein
LRRVEYPLKWIHINKDNKVRVRCMFYGYYTEEKGFTYEVWVPVDFGWEGTYRLEYEGRYSRMVFDSTGTFERKIVKDE